MSCDVTRIHVPSCKFAISIFFANHPKICNYLSKFWVQNYNKNIFWLFKLFFLKVLFWIIKIRTRFCWTSTGVGVAFLKVRTRGETLIIESENIVFLMVIQNFVNLSYFKNKVWTIFFMYNFFEAQNKLKSLKYFWVYSWYMYSNWNI